MDELTSADSEDGSSRSAGAAPRAMLGRWLAAIPGAAATALLIGIACARSIGGEDTSLAVSSGGFMAVCAWAVLAPLAILQRSTLAAWSVVGGALLLAGAWDFAVRMS